MAATGREPGPALMAHVVGQYARFDVFQLVRLLCHRSGAAAWPLSTRMRFRADLGSAFPGHEVSGLGRAGSMPAFRMALRGEQQVPLRIELKTKNYCLASEIGPLPPPFVEWARDQERIGGHAMSAFFDVFNQRIHVLRHELKQGTVRGLDDALPADTRYASQLAALMGIASKHQQRQIPLPTRAWLGLSALLVDRRRSGTIVEQVLSIYLGAPCTLRSLQGRWRPIEPRDRMRLGKAGNRLGVDSVAGSTTWDARASVAIEITGLSFEACCDLLPLKRSHPEDPVRAEGHAGLVAMIRMLLDRRFDCGVAISMRPETAPRSRLTLPWKRKGIGMRLGQTAWLGRYREGSVRFDVTAYDEGMVGGSA